MVAYCQYNPQNNPYWCNLIQGYCQFQNPNMTDQHCPIYNGCPKWEAYVPEDEDITDEFIQTHGYLTIYQKVDGQDRLVSLGDTAFQKYVPEYEEPFSIELPYVRYIGRYAFQDCITLEVVDFTKKTDDEIPILASPEAFMMSDGQSFVNETFQVKIPQRLYDKWVSSTNWTVVNNHIIGV